MKFNRIAALLLTVAVSAALLSGCKPKDTLQPELPTPMVIERPTPEPEPLPEPEPTIANPLTGESTTEEIRNRRPFAIMLNNLPVALPQYGVSQADVIFELLAEGGITRMLGLFQDVDGLGSIGSVRSARPYYIDLAQGYDAIYIHAGGSPQAYSDLKAKGIDHFDGVNGSTASLFFRDQARIRSAGYEHSMFTSGDRLSDVVDGKESLRHTHTNDTCFRQEFTINGTPAGGEDAPLLRAWFTGGKRTSFEYDAPAGLYRVYEYDAPYVDGATGAHVGVTNVLCLFTDVSQIRGDDKGRMAIRTTGEGTGWFACGGKAISICWSRPTLTEPFAFTLQKDGTPLTLGIGHSYVCVLPNGADVTFTKD